MTSTVGTAYSSDQSNNAVELRLALYDKRNPLASDGNGNLIKAEVLSSEENKKAWEVFQQLVLVNYSQLKQRASGPKRL